MVTVSAKWKAQYLERCWRAAAVGFIFGMSVTEIAESLRSVEPPPQRGEVLKFNRGFTVINDSYNSNPSALLSMVETLVSGARNSKRKIVVAGEMLELGSVTPKIHRSSVRTLTKSGIDHLIGVRGLAAEMVAGAKGPD